MTITNEEAIARIKVLLSTYYEDLGRETDLDLPDLHDYLIAKIEQVLDKTDINSKLSIPLRLKIDKLNEKDREDFWLEDEDD